MRELRDMADNEEERLMWTEKIKNQLKLQVGNYVVLPSLPIVTLPTVTSDFLDESPSSTGTDFVNETF